MSPEDLHRLIEEYRDGAISAADARRLAEAIRADAGTAAQVRRELAFSGHLGQSLEEAGDETFVRSFSERLDAERGEDEFMVAFEKRSSARRTRRIAPPRPSLVPFLAAAGLLCIAIAAVLAQMGRTSPAPVVRKQDVPPPAPEEPRTPPRPAPAPPPAPPPPAPETPRPPAPLPAVPTPPTRPEEPRPADPAKPSDEPKPAPVKPIEPTRAVVVARLDRIEGAVFTVVEGDRKPAAAGQEIVPGMSVFTAKNGSAMVVLADGTRIGLAADSAIRDIAKGPRGSRILIHVGTVTADVAKQPADQPLVFATMHAEARVLGTVLRLVVDAASTRLEVREGKVRLTREGKTVDVASGQFAVAAVNTPFAARSLSPDEIVLLAPQARLTGAEWSLQRDSKSLTGVALEAGATTFKVVDHVATRPSYATFTFFASADKEYRIWMRVASQEKGDPWTRDMLTIEPLRATMDQKSPFFGAAPTTAWVVTGAATTPGYSWLSASGEELKLQAPPLVVKFQETGFQTLRLFVGHPWVRVDALWLSATQKTRPAVKALPPVTEKQPDEGRR